MKVARLILLVGAVGIGISAAALRAEPLVYTMSSAAPTTEPMPVVVKSVSGAVEKIKAAHEPSEAIAGYSEGVALAGNNSADDAEVERTYIRKMIDFGMPEMADAQARDLTKRDPSDGVAWGVCAFMSARGGQEQAAITQINTAAKQAPNDRFIQRTAAQLLAWYDARIDHSQLPASATVLAEDTRHILQDQADFSEAYGKAHDKYADGPGPATAPTTANTEVYPPPVYSTTPQQPEAAPTYAYVSTYTSPYITYTDPYLYSGYVYGPTYPYPYAYYPYWGYPSTFFFFGNVHDHFHDHGHFVGHPGGGFIGNRPGFGGGINRPGGPIGPRPMPVRPFASPRMGR